MADFETQIADISRRVPEDENFQAISREVRGNSVGDEGSVI